MGWVQGVGSMFRGSVGGQSRVVTPVSKAKRPPGRRVTFALWGMKTDNTHDMWVLSDSTAASSLISIPDSTDDGKWYAGASDGTFHYHAALVSGEMVVLKFDASMSTLLDTWSTGWIVGDSPEPVPNILTQHVCANGSRVVAIVDLRTSGVEVGIGIAVFNTSGSLLDSWVYTTSGVEDLATNTGSATDGNFVYFWMVDTSSDVNFPGTQPRMVKVDLSDGTLTKLFWRYDVFNTTSDLASVSNGQGLVVAANGDLIFCTADGVARMTQAGGFVWWTSTGTLEVQALCHSGGGNVCAFARTFAFGKEFQSADGEYVRDVDGQAGIVQHAWLGPS